MDTTTTDGPDPPSHVSHRTVELPTVQSRQQQVRQKTNGKIKNGK